MAKTKSKPNKRYFTIFRAWITKNGKKLWAKDYGLKAWAIRIEIK